MKGFQPFVACLFRQVPNVVAKALGFSTSTRRKVRTTIRRHRAKGRHSQKPEKAVHVYPSPCGKAF
jgi:hypothetical protein